MATEYNTRDFAGQGVLRLAKLNPDGTPQGFQDMGNATALSVSFQTERRQKREMRSGKQNLVKSLVRQITGTAQMTVDSIAKENLEILYYGQTTALAVATITAEAHTAYVGKGIKLARMNLTAFTSLTDGGTTTYDEGTDYTVNLRTGMVDILPGGALADGDDVEANYAAGASERTATFTEVFDPYYLLFEGLNTSESDAPVIIECFRLRLEPPAEWQLIQEDGFTEFQVSGELEQSDAYIDDGGLFRITATPWVA